MKKKIFDYTDEVYNYINSLKVDLSNNLGVDLLYDSLDYHFSIKGKMLRPLLMISVNEDLNGKFSNIKNFAVALELIHNYSLIHDDLPAMDDDDYRRGQLTVHKKFDEATAILCGDYLLTKAFEIISQYVEDEKMLKNHLKAINILAKNANDFGMIGGQFLDLNTAYLVNKNNIIKMYEYKTSALFKSAFLIPGIICDVSSTNLEKLERLGRNFGLYFQIKDDLDDIEEDQIAGKITILRYLPIEEVERALVELKELIIEDLDSLGLNSTKEILSDLYEK